MTALAAQSLTFAFSQNDAVFRDVSLEFHPGELLVLLGGNGSGKTTLLRTLAGQLVPQSGNVLLDDRPVGKWSRREIAERVALMPQSERCETSFSVREMVQLGRAAQRGWLMPLTREDELAVDEALAATDMIDFAEQSVATLSGGQWRRAIFARSLAQDASVLLLDEPTSGLDLKHQYDCLEQIRRLVKEKQLVAVLALHDLNHAAMFADRIALLANQQLLAIGKSADVLTADLIEQTYGVRVTITRHPVNGTPLIVPLGPVADSAPTDTVPETAP